MNVNKRPTIFSPTHPDYCVVYVTFPSKDTATMISEQALKEKLCACVNVFSPHESWYIWEGQQVHDTEIAAFFKTRASCVDGLITLIKHHHPYDVPCIIALPILQGDGEFLNWIDISTATGHKES